MDYSNSNILIFFKLKMFFKQVKCKNLFYKILIYSFDADIENINYAKTHLNELCEK